MALVTPAEFDAATRLDFEIFLERVFAELNPSTKFAYNFHIDIIAHKLEQVRLGNIRRLIINVPPRSLKSIAASVAFPAWVLGHDPTKKVVAISYGQELADLLARQCRQVMQQQWYQTLFPACRLSPTRQAVHDFETTMNGNRIASSVGGAVTGRGGALVIIDDPIKPDDARSDIERRRANEWYRSTLVSRLDDKTVGGIVLVMQRLHEDDMIGLVLTLDDWEVVSFPAIAQEDEIHVVETPMGSYTHRRAEGEALHPAREPLHVLESLRRSIGAQNFAAQYLQMPTPPGGGVIKVAWFQAYDVLPQKFDRIIQSWDTASVVTNLADYSVCTTWGVSGADFYLMNVLRRRFEYPELKAAVKSQAELYRNPTVLIENKGSGIALLQELRRENLNVTKYEPKGDKRFRMEGQTALLENGRVHIPREAHWREDFLHEMVMFPAGKYDDQVDSMSQALEWTRSSADNGPEALIAMWKRAEERRRGDPEEPTIRVRGTAGGLSTLTGRQLTQGPDGCFLLTEAEWAPLRNLAGWKLADDN